MPKRNWINFLVFVIEFIGYALTVCLFGSIIIVFLFLFIDFISRGNLTDVLMEFRIPLLILVILIFLFVLWRAIIKNKQEIIDWVDKL